MASEAYSVIEPIKDRLYPKTFKYVHLVDGKERTVESPLFGDLAPRPRGAVAAGPGCLELEMDTVLYRMDG